MVEFSANMAGQGYLQHVWFASGLTNSMSAPGNYVNSESAFHFANNRSRSSPCCWRILVRSCFTEEIRTRLWPGDTVVEFDHGINVAIQKLRGALSESAEHPRYVETSHRTAGYRFIGEIEQVGPELAPGPPTPRHPASTPPRNPTRAKAAETVGMSPSGWRWFSA